VNGNEINQDERKQGVHDADSDESTMPLGIGGTDDGDGFEAASDFSDVDGQGKRGLNNGAMLVIGVIVAAAIVLFSMKTFVGKSMASDANMPNEVEQSIESFLSMLHSSKSADGHGPAYQIGAEQAAVLDVLNESYASRQVALTDVQRNPFIIFEETIQPTAPSTPRGPDPIKQKQQNRRTLFEQAAGRLEVRSVLMGATPLATIGSNIVQVGGKIIAEPESVSFTVLSISNDGVVIVAEDAELDVRYETTLTINLDRPRRGAPQRSNQRGPVRPR
jgi:hypothetical protein